MAQSSINVNLAFSAQTKQAEQSILKLQNALNKLSNTKVDIVGGSVDSAIQSVQTLKTHLERATNVDTGRINFNTLQKSLKGAGTSISELSQQLLALGPEGTKAFNELSNALVHAETATKTTNVAVQKFGETLVNTIRWSAASAIINGVVSTMTNAVRHVEKLDKALTDIKIVSNKTNAELATFAKQANVAAKELKTTTTEYANASLIFFQQGLDASAVKERTEATIKMAKVTGASVTEASNQLTAIWNNFADGSHSLEYYADALAALGAATASSTDEIATGLQKFAAIAETVGLSYEYAAAALATVTSETRESAEVVGNAYKTLFARIQGLQLGETLEDGTTLNKYSEALARVGISIKDSAGNMRNMDDILDDMGSKWQTLSQDQKVALAETVAGVRQYSQMMALMDNWGTFKVNLEIAETADGALNQQFDAYQESIEAVNQELQTSWEKLYQNLFSSDLIKEFKSVLTDIIGVFDTLIDKIGGLQGLAVWGGLILLKTFLPKLPSLLGKITESFKNTFGITLKSRLQDLEDEISQTRQSVGAPIQKEDVKPSAKGERSAAAEEALQKRAKAERQRRQLFDQDSFAGMDQHTSPEYGITVKTGETSQIDSKVTSAAEMTASYAETNADYQVRILELKKQQVKMEGYLTDKQKEGIQNHIAELELAKKEMELAQQKAVRGAKKSEDAMSSVSVYMEQEASKQRQAIIKNDKNIQEAQQKKDEAQSEKASAIAELRKELELAEDADENTVYQTARSGGMKATQGSALRKYEGARKKYRAADSQLSTAISQAKQQTRNITATNVTIHGEETATLAQGIQDLYAFDSGANAATSQVAAIGQGGEVSFEKLREIGQLQGEFTVGVGQAKGLQAELNMELNTMSAILGDQYDKEAAIGAQIDTQVDAKKRTKKEEQALQKLTEQSTKASKKLSQFLEKNEDTVRATAAEMKVSESLLNKMQQKEGFKITDLSPAELEELSRLLGGVEQNLQKGRVAAQDMSEAMTKDLADKTKRPVEEFTKIAEGAAEAVEGAAEVETAKENMDEKGKKGGVKTDFWGSITEGGQEAINTVTAVAAATTSFSTGFQLLFDKNTSAAEKLSGGLMIVEGVMSTISAVQSALNLVDTIATAITAAKAKATNKATKATTKHTGAIILDTIANAKNAASAFMASVAHQGWAGILMGAVGVSIIGAIIGISLLTVHQNKAAASAEEAAEKNREQAEASQEATEAALEEYDAMLQLIEAYEAAYEVYQKTGESKAELIDTGYDAINAMDVEGGALLLLQERYEELAKKIREAAAAKAQQAWEESQGTATSAGSAIKTALEKSYATMEVSGDHDLVDAQGNQINGDAVRANGRTPIAIPLEAADLEAIEKYLAENGDKHHWKIIKGQGESIGTYLYADYADDRELMWLYQDLNSLYSGAKNYALINKLQWTDTSDFALGQHLSAIQSSLGENVDLIDTAVQTSTQASVTQAKSTAFADVENQIDYNKAYEEYIQRAFTNVGLDYETSKNSEIGQDLLTKAREAIQSDATLTEYELNRQAIEQASAVSNAVNKFIEDGGVFRYAQQHNMDDSAVLELLVQVAPNETNIEEALNRIKEQVDTTDIIAEIDLVTKAKSTLKETMSQEDWSAFVNDYESVLQDVGITLVDFQALGYDKQIELLNQYTEQLKSTNPYEQLAIQQQKSIDAIEAAGVQGMEERYLQALNKGWEQLTAEEQRLLFESEEEYKKLAADTVSGDTTSLDAKILATYEMLLASEKQKLEQFQKDAINYNAAQFDEKIKEADLDSEVVYHYAQQLQDNLPILEDNIKGAQEMALANSITSDSYEGLADVVENYNKILRDPTQMGSAKYNQGLLETKKILSELINVDVSSLSDDFVTNTEILNLMQGAAQGNVEAITRLQQVSAQKLLLGENFNIDSASSIEQQAYNKLSEITNAAWQQGDALDVAQEESLRNIAKELGKSEQDLNNILKAAGFVFDGESWIYRGSLAEILSEDTFSQYKKELEKLREELDIYKDIDAELSEIERTLNRIAKAKERAAGAAKIEFIGFEKENIEKNVSALEQRLEIAKSEVQNSLEDIWQFGVETDDKGDIVDQVKLEEEWLNKLYRGDVTQEQYNEFTEAIADYEAALQEYYNTEDELIDAYYAKQDIILEDIQERAQLKININTEDLELLEYQLSNLEDPAYDAAAAIDNLAQQALIHANTSQAAQQGIYETLTAFMDNEKDIAAIYAGDFSVLDKYSLTQEQTERLQEYQDLLKSSNQAFKDISETIQSRVHEAFDSFNADMQEQIDRVEHMQSMLTHYSDIVDLVGEDILGIDKEVSELLSSSLTNTAIDQVEMDKMKLDSNRQALADAQNAYNQAVEQGNTQAVKSWEETIKHISQQIEENEQNLANSLTQALEAATTAFESSVERIINAFGKGISGLSGSLENLMTNYERQTTVNEAYADDYQKIYELSKLTRDINNSINNTTNIKGKQELAKLQEEINKLSASNAKVSEYELETLQKRYDLKVAEIALEESQNAKSQVRMQRGADGAWSYIYTADENKISEAQQNYEDKLYELQSFNQEAIKTLPDQILEVYQIMTQDLAALNPNDPDYKKKKANIIAYYDGLLDIYSSQLEIALNNSKTLYDEDWANYAERWGTKRSANDMWVDEFNETILGTATGYDNLNEYTENWVNNTKVLTEDLSDAWNDWYHNTDRALNAAGYSMDDFGMQVQQNIADIGIKVSGLKENMADLADKSKMTFSGIAAAAASAYTSYQANISGIVNSNDSLINSLSGVVSQANSAASALTSYINTVTSFSGKGNWTQEPFKDDDKNDYNNYVSYDNSGRESAAVSMSYEPINVSGYFNENLSGPTKLLYFYKDASPLIWNHNFTKGLVELSGGWYYLSSSSARQIQHLASSVTTSSSFDTGGYTGSWDSSGRLAMLHQKELVLNAQDTTNFLSAVNIVRDIARAIDLQAVATQGLFSTIAPRIITGGSATSIEQNVTIHADFPGVSSRSEIVEAFNTLYNRAAQFANRKN